MIKAQNKYKLHISEPNLIPLLDFLLVLIVMFALLAGPLQQALKLPLPEVKSAAQATSAKDNLILNVVSRNNIQANGQQFNSVNELETYLKANSSRIKEMTIAIDKSLEVDTLIKIFAIAKTLGITTANIRVEQEI